MFYSAVVVKLVAFLLVANSAVLANTVDDNPKAHHTPDGFKNIYYDDAKGFLDFVKWRWQKSQKDIPKAQDYRFDVVKPDLSAITGNTTDTRLTWIGHATFLLQFDGLNILTDPQFSDRASPFSFIGPRRVVAPGIAIKQLPPIDAVVVSHDHYDSLDVDSIKQLSAHNGDKSIHFMVPLGLKSWLSDLGLNNIKAHEMDWGESFSLGSVKFTAEPVQHWGKRTLFDAFDRLWASWVIENDSKGRVYFAGDTGYAPHFKQLGEKYGAFNLALLPIGAYEPRWFMKPYHVNPTESVQIHQDINAKYSVAMHWGTFILTDEPLTEPPLKLAGALKAAGISQSEFEVYKHGQSRVLNHLF